MRSRNEDAALLASGLALYEAIYGKPPLRIVQVVRVSREAYSVGVRLGNGCPLTRAAVRSGLAAVRAGRRPAA